MIHLETCKQINCCFKETLASALLFIKTKKIIHVLSDGGDLSKLNEEEIVNEAYDTFLNGLFQMSKLVRPVKIIITEF